MNTSKIVEEIVADYSHLLESLNDTNYNHLTTEDLITIHDAAIKPGQPKGIQDSRGLAGVVKHAKIVDTNCRSVWAIAATYMYDIAYGQVFKDGNKRTGLLAGLSFLAKNGVDASNKGADDALYDLMMGYMGHDPAYTVDRGERLLKSKYPLVKAGVQESKAGVNLMADYSALLDRLGA